MYNPINNAPKNERKCTGIFNYFISYVQGKFIQILPRNEISSLQKLAERGLPKGIQELENAQRLMQRSYPLKISDGDLLDRENNTGYMKRSI